MSSKKYFKDFPEIEIPEFLQGIGWVDDSWYNDAAPHVSYDLPNGGAIVMWVSHDDPSKRECMDMPKFLVEFQPNASEWTDNGRVLLYEGDDEEAIKALDLTEYT